MQVKETGYGCGKRATEVVASIAAVDLSAEQIDACTEDEIDIRVGVEDFDKPGDLVERCCEVGVPVADASRAGFDGFQ